MTGKKKMCIFILKIKIQQQFQLIFFLKNINRKKKNKKGKLCFKKSCLSSSTGFNMHNILYGEGNNTSVIIEL